MKEAEHSETLTISESIIIGLGLNFSLLWSKDKHALPLISLPNPQILEYLSPLFSIIIMFFLLFYPRKKNSIFIFIILNVIFNILFFYTFIGAFNASIIYLCIFYILNKHQDANSLRTNSTLFVSLMFLLAAIQKMNMDYLNGNEFFRNGSFFVYLYKWFPNSAFIDNLSQIQFLPHLSIALELIFAFGIWLKPDFVVHAISLFLLILTFLHPPVLYVYYFLLPMHLLISRNFLSAAQKLPFSKYLTNPFFWFFLLSLKVNLSSLRTTLIASYVLCAALILWHSWLLTKSLKNSLKTESIFYSPSIKKKNNWILPLIMFSAFLSSFFIPNPLGFNMFAAKQFQHGSHSLFINKKLICAEIQSHWHFKVINDASFLNLSKNNCEIRFPTKSGITHLLSFLCKKFDNIEAEVKYNKSEHSEKIKCSDLE